MSHFWWPQVNENPPFEKKFKLFLDESGNSAKIAQCVVAARSRYDYVNNHTIGEEKINFNIEKGWNSKTLSLEAKNAVALTCLITQLLEKKMLSFNSTLHCLLKNLML